MRIERHQVEEEALTAAREGFVDRIGSMVNTMSKAGRMGTSDWELISAEFLDCLGALSVEHPDLDTAEARALLADAAEAATGMVSYAAYFPRDSFSVFLNYVNFGMSYDREADGERETVGLFDWHDAFCLAVLTDTTARHGEAFSFALEPARQGKAGQPGAELAAGLMAYVLGITEDDEAPWPLPPEDTLAALDAALARVERPDHPDTLALRGLRALAAGDREEFDAALTELLRHAAWVGGSFPRALLPLTPLALAALAHRDQGWEPPVESGYLPRALVTGFESKGVRVGAFGRDRRPDAVAELAAGPVTFERPGDLNMYFSMESVELFEEFVADALKPLRSGLGDVDYLAGAVKKLRTLVEYRAREDAEGSEGQLDTVRRMSRFGAALFRTMLAEPGTEVEVELDGTTLSFPAHDGREAGPELWHAALNAALITGAREDLAPLVLSGPARLRTDRSGRALVSYRRALLDYLRAEDAGPAAERAVGAAEKAQGQGFLPPPAVLLSQLVEGDEESFNLALLDALEAHRDHFAVADRGLDPEAVVNLDILALTCHARRRGWALQVVTPYLPPRVLCEAQPL
ncbi:Imm49 family immunity protein [Streptomyces sp. NPDC048172]|uniref:immunity 49 family protein n=1 Tax=Streptomyces sp. NPDC048172 TaxID=3365505 RepID=UPI0037196036